MFPLAQLCQDPRLLTKLFEPADSALNGLVFSNPDSRHDFASPPLLHRTKLTNLCPQFLNFILFVYQVKLTMDKT